MKKLLSFIFAFSILHAWVFAGAGYGPVAVIITADTENDGNPYFYKLNTEDWPGNEYVPYNENSALDNMHFGIVEELTLDGGQVIAWSNVNGPTTNDGDDWFQDDSFTIQYRTYLTGETPEAWNTIPLDNLLYSRVGNDSNNEVYNYNGQPVDLLASLEPGEYTLEIRWTRKNYYYYWGESSWYEEEASRFATFIVADDRPVAGFTVFTVGMAGIPLQFTNTSVNADSYTWNFGDGGSGNDENPAYTFSSSGTFDVTLTAQNSAGSRTQTRQVTIVDPATGTNKISGGDMASDNDWFIATQGKPQPSLIWGSGETPAGGSTALRITKNSDEDGFVLYQPVSLEANKTYVFDCLVKDFGTASNVWVQVFISDSFQPSDVSDITSGDIPETATIGQLNSWVAGADPAGYDGKFIDGAVKGTSYTGDLCTFVPTETGMYYLMLRIGTWYGDMNLALSDLSLTEDDGQGTGACVVQEDTYTIQTGNASIVASFEGVAEVALFNTQGVLLAKETASGLFHVNELPAGIYILTINHKNYKVSVR